MLEKIGVKKLNNIIDNKANFYFTLLQDNFYLECIYKLIISKY